MASTTPANVDSSILEVWADRTLRDTLYAGFWGSKVGPAGARSPIIRQTELLDRPGDVIHIQITNPLVGAGVQGDTTVLTGSEEALATAEIKTVPDLYRHAVRMFRMAEKKSIEDLRAEARMRLAEHAGERMDDIRFAAFVANTPVPGSGEAQGAATTPIVHKVGGGAAVPTTAWVAADFNDILAADTLTVAELQKIKLKLYNQRALPLMTKDGQRYFAMVVHPNSLYNLKRESEYRDWVRVAHVQGEQNPFFQGATAMIDGMLLFEHVNVPTITNTAGVPAVVSRNLAFGAEAFVEGLGENTKWWEEEFDYGNEYGIAYSFQFQPRRALSKNSIQVWAAADPVT
jgi:N4-gp56 family major capsid protein